MQLAMKILNKQQFPRETLLNTSVVDQTNALVMQMQTTHIHTLDNKIEMLNGKVSQYLDRYTTQKLLLLGSLFALSLVVGLLIAVYATLRAKNRLNHMLSEQKGQLEHQRDKLEQQKSQLRGRKIRWKNFPESWKKLLMPSWYSSQMYPMISALR